MLKRQTMLRTALAGLVGGAILIGAAWAAVVATPTDDLTDGSGGALVDPLGTVEGLVDDVTTAAGSASNAGSAGAPRPAGLLAGAAKASIAPRPGDYDGTWETDPDLCRTLEPAFLEHLGTSPGDLAHLADTGSPWPENPNCIYQGGFDLGPMNPVSAFDEELGLWVRSVAIGDGTNTIVLTIIDAEGWLWDYATKCGDCGAERLSIDLGAELGIDPAGIVIASTHSHAAPDFIGGWGFVPDWYMHQVRDTIRTTVRRAVAAMEPAVIEVGEFDARDFNRERRDTYYSAETQQAAWFRAYVPGRGGSPARVIATVGAYAAHPVTKGTNGGIAHPDWPGVFEHELERRFGGIGLHFMTGLGNMSPANDTGHALAALVPPAGGGTPVARPVVSAVRTRWRQPVTNAPLGALGAVGLFDRKFDLAPATVSAAKSSTAPCVSASVVSVEVAAAVLRLGDDLAITTGPGELFSNLTNTIMERSPARVTMPLSQANDALGYIPQSFELSPIGQQGLGFFLGGYLIVNYEDSYAVDRCFGDEVLERTLQLLGG